jgi:hypothetical protein
MNPSPKFANEIDRLMRDPDALRPEREGMQHPGGHGHYNPNQPRVPAGDPRGGQFASKGYRGRDSGREAGATRASLDGTQFAQLGSGPTNPRDAYAQAQPFEGQLGNIGAGQHLASQNTFNQMNSDRRRDRRDDFESYDGRYRFLSMGPHASEPIPGGTRWVVSSTTYAYDDTTGAYATISATPARPIIIDFYHGKLVVTPVNPAIRRR